MDIGHFLSLSERTTETLLAWSEYGLVFAGAVLVAGIVGEYKLPFWHHRLKLFELLVLIGCGGELIADAGVVLCSEHLQSIQHSTIGDLRRQADAASEKIAQSSTDSDAAKTKAEEAVTTARHAKKDAELAQSKAEKAKGEADLFERDIVAADKQVTELKKQASQLNRALETEDFFVRNLQNEVGAREINVFDLQQRLSRFAGTLVLVEWTNDAQEVKDLAEKIAEGLSFARWMPPGNDPGFRTVVATPLRTAALSQTDILGREVWVLDPAISDPGSPFKNPRNNPDSPGYALVEALTSVGHFRVNQAGARWNNIPTGVMVVLVGPKNPSPSLR